MTMHRPTIIERAFALARTGRFNDDIRRKLKAEHYDSVDSHTSSASLMRQIKRAREEINGKDRRPASGSDSGTTGPQR